MIVMPIIAIYWQNQGLSIQDIFLLQVIFSVAIVLLEIPSGYFGDVFGRKGSLVLGVLMGTLGFFLYFLATSFTGFAIAEIALALSAAFLSGADSAFLYDTLQQFGVTQRHVKYQGRIISATKLSEAIAALASGLLLIYLSFKALFFAQFIVMALAIPIVLTMREPEIPVTTKKRKSIIEILRFALHENKKLLYLNIFSGVISASTLAMVWFAQPYWKELDVSIVYFGVMWAGLNILVSISAFFAHKVESYVSFRTLFAIFAIAPLLLYGLLGIGVGLYALIIIPLFWILRGFFQPISLDYINRETDSSIRATVVSVSQLFSRLAFAIISPFLGWVADVWSLEVAFQASSLIFGILAIIAFLLLYSKMKPQTVS
jgi:MFS family permease